MKCNKCGFDIVESKKFCPNCGEQLNNDKANDKYNLDLTNPEIKAKYNFTYISLLVLDGLFGLLFPVIQILHFFVEGPYSSMSKSYVIDNWLNISVFIGVFGLIISIIVFLFTAFSKYKKDPKFKKIFIASAITFCLNVILIFLCASTLGIYFISGFFEWLKGCE